MLGSQICDFVAFLLFHFFSRGVHFLFESLHRTLAISFELLQLLFMLGGDATRFFLLSSFEFMNLTFVVSPCLVQVVGSCV